jgi:hypothetical protein
VNKLTTKVGANNLDKSGFFSFSLEDDEEDDGFISPSSTQTGNWITFQPGLVAGRNDRSEIGRPGRCEPSSTGSSFIGRGSTLVIKLAAANGLHRGIK